MFFGILQCELFSLQLMQCQLNILIVGMFELNMQSSLALWSFTLRHTLILVQFEYENRFRNFRNVLSWEMEGLNYLVNNSMSM